jgi:RNA polymerase sigma-70 factor (ECF subfamily)
VSETDFLPPIGLRMTDSVDRLQERVLVLRCQAGDEAAFAELVGKYSQRLRYYLWKMLKDQDRVQDILQDVWLQVLRGMIRLENPDALAAWLYRIARDQVYSELRKRCSHVRLVDDLESVADACEDLRWDDAEYIQAALDQLAPEHREVLMLRFLEDMTYQEIGAVIGCAVGTVRSRIHYAKRAVRSALERMNAND